MAQSDFGESTKRIQTCSRCVLPTSTSTSVSFSATSFFCSAERPSYHSIVTIGMALRGRCEGRLDLLNEPALRQGADDLVRRLAVLEQDERGDRHHVVTRGGLLVVVDVQLDDAQVLPLLGDLLEARRDHTARPAPRG